MSNHTPDTGNNQDSRKAPSEKHLEDWIVANPDLVQVQYDEPDPEHGWDGYVPMIDKIIKRQVRLPSGICDLIVSTSVPYAVPTIAVVELKKDVIDSKAVTQCLRYMRDLREIFYNVAAFRKEDGESLCVKYRYHSSGIIETLNGYWPEVIGMMIGRSIESKHLQATCEASNIHVVTYEYKDGVYSFDEVYASKSDVDEIYTDFANGAIGDAMRDVMVWRYKRHMHFVGGES